MHRGANAAHPKRFVERILVTLKVPIVQKQCVDI